MCVKNTKDLSPPLHIEKRKRKREIFVVFVVAFLFVFLTWFEVRLFNTSQQLRFEDSIFFFGLVNFNIILFLLMIFLIFRNIVKVFVERKGKILGSSLKAKLIAAFTTFSFIPTLLMFVISVFYINSSFDKWFNVKMIGVLKSSIEVNDAYYKNAKNKNYHFARIVAAEVYGQTSVKAIEKTLKMRQREFALDSVEFYPAMIGPRIVVTNDQDSLFDVPPVSLEFLQKGINSQVDASHIHQFGEGNLVRVIVPVKEGEDRGAIVVSSFVPLSLISRLNDVTSVYQEFRDSNPLEYPLKSIYLIILVLMTLVILLAATWFGFYMAKQLSIPLVQLGYATQNLAKGQYTTLDIQSGSEEISALIGNFNSMSKNLEASQKNLKETLNFNEVVLANVSAGVISVDRNGKISTINRHASQLLKIDTNKYIGRSVRELLTIEYFRIFAEMLKSMQEHGIESIQKELKVNVAGETLPLLMNLSVLKDHLGQEVGKILVFDDLTPILNAQRSAAWTEVARRIAHEIKNPLTPIKLSAERLRKKFAGEIKDPAFEDCTTMIIKQVDDLKNLVNEFSNFARLPQSKPVLGSFNKCIEDTLVLFREAHSDVKFTTQLDQNLPEFKFDPDQMRRVMVNLIDNSVAASQKSPQPSVTVDTKYDRDLKLLRVAVADNGEGIPSRDRQRIFEPYFSTKEYGTGLGLAIVKRIIEDHNGFIRAHANEPKGTRMVMEIPIHSAQNWVPQNEGASS